MALGCRPTPCALELDLPHLISKIPPTCNMKEVGLSLTLESESAVRQFGWRALGRVLATMTQCRLHLDISISPSSTGSGVASGDTLEKFIHEELKGLRRSGRLGIRLYDRTD